MMGAKTHLNGRRTRLPNHPLRGTPVWSAWSNMRQRCGNPRHADFHRYGGRGITVCERWRRFAAFAEDMAPSHRSGLELDRIDPDGGYESGNCRWVTEKVQASNRSTVRWLETPWGRMHMSDAAKRAGVHLQTMRERLDKGWTAPRLFGGPER